MIDSEFDDFTRGRLGNHEVPVPAGLWDKLSDKQFDQFIGDKLKGNEAPVPDGTWDKIADGQFDNFFAGALSGAAAPVPSGLWEKITDGQFDGFVSGKLSGYEAPVPAGLWEKIMPEKDDDTGGFIWFKSPARAVAYLAVLISLLGGGYYWFTNSQKNTAPVPAAETATTTPSGTTPNGNKPSANTPATNAQGLTPGNESNNSATLPVDVKTEKNDAGNTAPGVTGNSPAAPSQLNNVNDGLSANVYSRNRKANIAGQVISGQKNNLPSATTAKEIVGTPANTINQNNSSAANNNTDTENNFGFIEPYQTNHLSATPIPYVRKEIGMINKTLSPNHANRHKSVIICPSDKGINTDWLVEAYVSPDFAFRSISSNTASQQYMLRKDSSESMRPGLTAGIRLVKPITDNILLKTGVQFTQMNQKYVYRTENEVKTITEVIRRTIIRGPGDTVIVMDTSVTQQIGFKNNTVINRFRSIDVPVMAGYQFGLKGDDIRIGINAGVIFNLSSWYQGVMLDTALATVSIPAKGSNNMVYKSKLGIGLYGGISITKKLGEDLDIFAEPYFRYNLSNMTTPNAPYNQKFSLGGVSLGIRLNLNRQ